MTRGRRRLAHLTPAHLRARSLKGWVTRGASLTAKQRAHHRKVYNSGLRRRLVRAGGCRSCCRPREADRRRFNECRRCAKVSAARARRTPRRWIPRSQMRTAA